MRRQQFVGLIASWLCFATWIVTPIDAQDHTVAAPIGRVEGILVNEVTSQPIRNGSLILRLAEQAKSDAENPAKSYTATSDGDGKFVFDRIEPGRYRLTASRPGFAPGTFTSKGSPNLSVQTRQPIASLRFPLEPYGLIAGQVVDENAEPLTEVRVSALRYGYRNGLRTLTATAVPTAVDDRGRFRIANLSPGKYVLTATPNPNRTQVSGTGPSYVATYYPQATDSSQAETLVLAAGAELNATIHLKKEQAYRVRGTLVDSSSGEPAQKFFLRLCPQSGAAADRYYSAMVQQDGAFEFPTVLPGSYVIRPDLMNITVRLPGRIERIAAKLFGQFPLNVEDRNLDGLVIKFRKGCSVSGKIVAADEEPAPPQQTPASPPPRVSLAAARSAIPLVRLHAELDGGEYSGAIKSDGTFAVDDVPPDRYRVVISGLPDGSYPKSLRVENQPLLDGLLDLTLRETVDLQIITSPKAASLSGTVQNENGEPLADAEVTVHPVADRAMGTVQLLHAKTEHDGRFEFKNLTPRDYELLAWEAVDINLAMNPDFYAQFESRAVRITLDPAAQSIKTLVAIPADAVHQAEAKLP